MSRTNKLFIAAAALVALASASSAFALSYDDVIIESWTGLETAANKAVMVVDFGDKSFAFGYRWDGAATGFDMASAIAGATALDIVDDTQYGGHLINSFSYNGYSLSYDSGNWYPNQIAWSYFTSTTGAAWTESGLGAAQRQLTDGAWDGWSWCASWPSKAIAPTTPTTPEPMSIAALAAGLGAIIIRRKRS